MPTAKQDTMTVAEIAELRGRSRGSVLRALYQSGIKPAGPSPKGTGYVFHRKAALANVRPNSKRKAPKR